ncbi:MAG TPA: beta-glucosidase BglX [Saprospirales bacterium]|nr:beta-glucosidase BglX [Saprospirales bacterium]
MRKTILLLIGILILGISYSQNLQKSSQSDYDPRIEVLLKKMTLEEKLGQLNQLSNPYMSTGTSASLETNKNYDQMVREGKIGSFLNVLGAEETKRLQKIAVEESRLGIPLIYGFDVVHGFKTIFPIPLGEAASFDREVMEKGARIAAIESAANGVHWTFAPMVDISRDPRWGRIMEGAGEDVFLGVEAATARVKGFQGNDLAADNTIAACAKHFAAYGAAYGGRDYNMADMSERMMREVYLPPFKAAVDAGVATLMSSFNTNGGVPASGDRWLQTDVLRGEWGFDGFVVSDWTSVTELIYHGIAENPKEAGYLGLNAGVDMDMMGSLYVDYGKKLIEEGRITEAQIDEMVRRVLHIKYKLGLFDNPYQYTNAEKQKQLTLHPDHLAASRDAAKRSIVLMKNKGNLLPLSKNIKKIAVIGPLAKDKDAPLGNWRGSADPNSAVSLFEGLQNAVGNNSELIFEEGARLTNNKQQAFFTQLEYNTSDRSGFKKAIAAAKKSDVVILAIGETAYMSGECRSYANIELKGLQLELLKEIKKTGKPVIVALFTGRPLVLTDAVDHADAILNCWLPGSEAGNAIADVIFGDYNPSGKLPASFPYHIGQIPVFYEELNTGRPYKNEPNGFSTKYRDIPNAPLFAFGYGMSYTNFEFSNLVISHKVLKMNESLTIKATLSNTGKYDGEEVVQLYIRDLVGKGVARPLLQLKGFEKVMVKKGESMVVSFTITPEDLAFFRLDKTWGPEAGAFEVFVGNASNNLPLKGKFELTE